VIYSLPVRHSGTLGQTGKFVIFPELFQKIIIMKQDIEIAQEAKIRPVAEIAQLLGIPQDELELYGNLGIDPRTIEWKRVMDMNERSLRDIVIGLGGTTEGVPRQSGFEITAASEVMATLCMARHKNHCLTIRIEEAVRRDLQSR
jgi:formyltetrahydrofolate synthetase